MTVLMAPDMANFYGKVHGGTVLKFLDQVAYACASRYPGRYVVTLSLDHVNICFSTMVAVDDERKPVAVPPLRPFSFEQKRRHAAAVVRKELRQEFGERFENLRKLPANPE